MTELCGLEVMKNDIEKLLTEKFSELSKYIMVLPEGPDRIVPSVLDALTRPASQGHGSEFFNESIVRAQFNLLLKLYAAKQLKGM